MPKARSSSALRSTRRAGLPSRSSTSVRLTRSSCSLASLSLPFAFFVMLYEVDLLLGVLVVALGFLREVVDALLEAVEVGEHQLGLDGLDVGERGDLALDMRDVGILEAAHDMRDGVDLADVGEELVAEAFTLGSAAHEAGDVDEGRPGRDDLPRLGDGRELVEPRIGHGDFADIRLDRAERIVRGLRRGR